MAEKMEIREFIERDIDVDVADDVCESLCIAFCGPLKLTDKGKEHFEDVLDFQIEVDEEYGSATVLIDGPGWKTKLRMAKEFFLGAAGYCSEANYQKWFA